MIFFKYIFIAFGLVVAKELIELIKEIKEKNRLKELEENKKWCYNSILTKNTTLRHLSFTEINDILRLSFKQWLSFYNISPDKWIIDINQTSYNRRLFCAMPVYKDDDNDKIITFWETPDDLWSFIEWQDNVYREKIKKTNERLSREKQEKELIKLTENLKKDLEEKNKQTQDELEQLEKQIKENIPKPKEDTTTIYAQCGRGNSCLIPWGVKQPDSIESLIDTLNYEYPDYYYIMCGYSIASDGNKVIELLFKHKYNNIKLQKYYIYNNSIHKWELAEKNYIYDNIEHEWKKLQVSTMT